MSYTCSDILQAAQEQLEKKQPSLTALCTMVSQLSEIAEENSLSNTEAHVTEMKDKVTDLNEKISQRKEDLKVNFDQIVTDSSSLRLSTSLQLVSVGHLCDLQGLFWEINNLLTVNRIELQLMSMRHHDVVMSWHCDATWRRVFANIKKDVT